MSLRWSSTRPTQNGRYLFRQVTAPQDIDHCSAVCHPAGTLEILHDDGDTLDKCGYEFSGPLTKQKG